MTEKVDQQQVSLPLCEKCGRATAMRVDWVLSLFLCDPCGEAALDDRRRDMGWPKCSTCMTHKQPSRMAALELCRRCLEQEDGPDN